MRAVTGLSFLLLFGAAFALTDDWESQFESARKLYSEGRYGACEKVLLSALELLTEQEGYRIAYTRETLASVFAIQGRHDEAAKQYELALEIRECQEPRLISAEVEVLLALTSSLRKCGQLDRALVFGTRAADRAARLAGDHPALRGRCQLLLAVILAETGKPDESNEVARTAIAMLSKELSPEHAYVAQGYLCIGLTDLNRFRLDEAEKALTLAGRLYTKADGAHSEGARRAEHGLAAVALRRGRYGDGLRRLEALVSAADRSGLEDEADAKVRLRIACLVLDAGIDEGVHALLSRSVRFFPDESNERQAQAAALAGKWSRAHKLFRAAEERGPGMDEERILLTRLRTDAFIREGRVKEAMKLLRSRAELIAKGMVSHRCLMAECHLVLKQYSQSADQAQKAITAIRAAETQHSVTLAWAEILLGRSHAGRKHYRKALDAFTQARKRLAGLGMKTPELTGSCLLGLARAERAGGKPEVAIDLLRKAVESFRPGALTVRRKAAPALMELAELLEARGDSSAAKELRREAESLIR